MAFRDDEEPDYWQQASFEDSTFRSDEDEEDDEEF